MSIRKQEQQQRLCKARQLPTIYEDSSNVSLPDPTSVPPPTPELDTCLDNVSTVLSNPNRAMLRRVFSSQRTSLNSCQWLTFLPAAISRQQNSEEPKSCLCSSTLNNCKQWQRTSPPCATLCLQNEHFSKKNGAFKMSTTGS